MIKYDRPTLRRLQLADEYVKTACWYYEMGWRDLGERWLRVAERVRTNHTNNTQTR
jgi:hypothetical protein